MSTRRRRSEFTDRKGALLDVGDRVSTREGEGAVVELVGDRSRKPFSVRLAADRVCYYHRDQLERVADARAAELGRRGGLAGSGASKRRGSAAYYGRLARRRWRKAKR